MNDGFMMVKQWFMMVDGIYQWIVNGDFHGPDFFHGLRFPQTSSKYSIICCHRPSGKKADSKAFKALEPKLVMVCLQDPPPVAKITRAVSKLWIVWKASLWTVT